MSYLPWRGVGTILNRGSCSLLEVVVTQTLQNCGYFIVLVGVRSEKLQNQSGPGAGACNFSDSQEQEFVE